MIINTRQKRPLRLRLQKDLTRDIKRGHAWLYSDAVEHVSAPDGSPAELIDRKDQVIASGMYAPDHPIAFRVCRTQVPFELDDDWLQSQLQKAWSLRKRLFDASTDGIRLVAGEGDGLPGMIVDLYGDVAVLKFDGVAPRRFYGAERVIQGLSSQAPVRCVVERTRTRGRVGEVVAGKLRENPTPFVENTMHFTADVIRGQKTGFFIDQRNNRKLIHDLSSGLQVLNLFSFSGGFSIAAGTGGAEHVTSVDAAAAAIAAAQSHWEVNGLDHRKHKAVVQDCFDFLEEAVRRQTTWDLVICDPPSFAPSERAKEKALTAYRRLAQLTARVTRPGGMLALASCSSHVNERDFCSANLEGIGRGRRRATSLASLGLPPDHPTPFAMPELRYLKFQLLSLD